MKPRELAKYLARGRVEVFEPAPLPAATRQAVVIPVLNESSRIGATLASLQAAAPVATAVILVVNHPPDAPESWRRDNAGLLSRLRRGEESGALELRWLDAGELADGVGEARKLGFDSFLAALGAERAAFAVLYSLDADSPVEPAYFRCLEAAFAAHPDWGGVTVGIRHQRGATPELERAIRRYEAYLERYARKLREIGSPYGYQAIGSGFAVRARDYLRCGGMRRRRAGEDFYFLQALAKCAPIGQVEEVLVHPAARLSERVPFGTGPALAGLLAGGELPEFPDARFAQLGELLGQLSELDDPALPERLAPELRAFLKEQNFASVWARIRRQTRPEDYPAAFHRWFDALKTQQFLRQR